MIIYIVYNALQIFYGTQLAGGAKETCMFLSGIELFLEIGGFIIFCIIYMPDILRNWRKR